MVEAFDYTRGYRRLQPEIDAAIARVLGSGRLILGPEVECFEQEFAHYVGAQDAVGVASGTDALELALRAVGVEAGDQVATVANTAVGTVAAIRAVGAIPQFVDVCDDTLLMDAETLRAAVTRKTRAVIPVHLFGQAVPMAPVLEIARKHGLPVIEDCSQAHGAQWQERHVGTFGDVGCFSLYPTKPLGAVGDGGICVTNRPEAAQQLRRLRMYGFDGGRPSAQIEGVNSRLDELQAAVLRVKLQRLDDALTRRQAVADAYQLALRGQSWLRGIDDVADAKHAHYVHVVRAPNRARLLDALTAAGIGYGIHYPEPIHLMPAYQFLGGQAGDLPITERACQEVVSLPMFPELNDDEIRQVADFLAASDRLAKPEA